MSSNRSLESKNSNGNEIEKAFELESFASFLDSEKRLTLKKLMHELAEFYHKKNINSVIEIANTCFSIIQDKCTLEYLTILQGLVSIYSEFERYHDAKDRLIELVDIVISDEFIQKKPGFWGKNKVTAVMNFYSDIEKKIWGVHTSNVTVDALKSKMAALTQDVSPVEVIIMLNKLICAGDRAIETYLNRAYSMFKDDENHAIEDCKMAIFIHQNIPESRDIDTGKLMQSMSVLKTAVQLNRLSQTKILACIEILLPNLAKVVIKPADVVIRQHNQNKQGEKKKENKAEELALLALSTNERKHPDKVIDLVNQYSLLKGYHKNLQVYLASAYIAKSDFRNALKALDVAERHNKMNEEVLCFKVLYYRTIIHIKQRRVSQPKALSSNLQREEKSISQTNSGSASSSSSSSSSSNSSVSVLSETKISTLNVKKKQFQQQEKSVSVIKNTESSQKTEKTFGRNKNTLSIHQALAEQKKAQDALLVQKREIEEQRRRQKNKKNAERKKLRSQNSASAPENKSAKSELVGKIDQEHIVTELAEKINQDHTVKESVEHANTASETEQVSEQSYALFDVVGYVQVPVYAPVALINQSQADALLQQNRNVFFCSPPKTQDNALISDGSYAQEMKLS